MSDFDPTRYLTKLKGKDYLEVKWRLVWLRSVHPDASISTRLEHRDANEAVFSSSVVLSTGGSATGWGSESKGDFGDYTEKAETKALGRALAALGFGTQFAGQDFDEGGAVADSPVQRQPQPKQQDVDTDTGEILSTDDQLRQDIQSVIAYANNALTIQHVRQAYKRADGMGLLNDPEVSGAIDAARARVTPAETAQAQLIDA